MKLARLRSPKALVPALVAVSALTVGGTVWVASADEVSGDERDRVADAATDAAGGGRALDVERSDDVADGYEVEVLLEDGREVDVLLDEDLAVIATEPDDRDDDGDSDDRDDDRDERPDADDRALTDAERTAAERAALAAKPGSTVVDVDASDDQGVAYEVEVRDADGLEWDIELDADFGIVTIHADR